MTIFSGLNQLNDISLSANKYASICGITQEELESNFKLEIKQLADTNNLTYEETLEKLKFMYNGYRFSKSKVSVYNPFSTILVLSHLDFGDYWFQTGTPTSLMKEVARVHFDITSFENKISQSQENISNYRSGSEDIVPLLF